MLKLAALMTKHLVMTIPAAMLLGFACGLLVDASALKMLVLPLSFLMVYPMMVNLKLKKLLASGDGKLQWVTQLLNFAVIPFVALLVARLAFADHPYLVVGLFLAALLPTSGMTISYTGLAGGNIESAIKMTVVGLIVGSIAAPFYLQFFLGAKVDIDMLSVARTIVVIVFLPMAAGYATQHWLVRKHGQKVFNEQYGAKLGPLSTFGVVGIVFVATAMKARAVAAEPALLLVILGPLALFYAVNYSLSYAVGKLMFARGDAIALLYGSVMRNLSIALAVVINAFGERGSEAALLISLAYIIQVQSAAWFVKFTEAMYAPKPASA